MAGNPLFDLLNGGAPQSNMLGMLQRFQQFKNTFKGDPRQQIQQMLNSGQISQEQYNNAVRMANEIQKFLN